MDDLKALLETYGKIRQGTNDQLARLFKALIAAVQETRRDLMAEIRARIAEIRQPADGKNGRDGKDGARGPKGERGERGQEGPQGRAGRDGKDGKNGRDVEPATVEAIGEKLEDFEERLSATKPGNGIFIGPSRGVSLYINGEKKGLQNNINLIPGAGVTLSYARTHGRNDITINASGSGGGSLGVLPATGAVNDSNTDFTFASEPTLVVVNGASYRDGHGCTIIGTSVTLDNPVGSGGDIYGLG